MPDARIILDSAEARRVGSFMQGRAPSPVYDEHDNLTEEESIEIPDGARSLRVIRDTEGVITLEFDEGGVHA